MSSPVYHRLLPRVDNDRESKSMGNEKPDSARFILSFGGWVALIGNRFMVIKCESPSERTHGELLAGTKKNQFSR